MGYRYKMVLGYSPTFKRNKCQNEETCIVPKCLPVSPVHILFFKYYFNKPSNIKVKVMV